MTSHAQPVSAPGGQKRSRKPKSVGAGKRKDGGEGPSMSVARMGLIGTIGAAILTGVPSIVIALMHDGGSGPNNSAGPAATPTTITSPTRIQPSPRGSFDQVAINDSGTAVTVAGSAEKDVDSVVVLVGPRQSGGQYWANSTNVVDGQWKLVVATDPHVPVPYQIKAFYREREAGAYYRLREDNGAIRDASHFSIPETGPTPTPPPPPEPLVSCAEQHGDSCFNGPGWGPPSVFQSDH
ncbi:hypothetical protein [Mycobacterium sp. 852002-51057_SCH5723018]|uniref:hypothetical protein n=1 Tax=Mycobacterium sp. 852002-51057_SCH5723018 TaxID=1834094 RepID=UPI0007FCA3A9|nr:hypothetical protein [Mycobacterium sp. 852002-51057_SCH5723018]OBG24643.1 hypothetical protein A5764_09640 [Mycobacterium sp. 852002-51057_SCH5723018]